MLLATGPDWLGSPQHVVGGVGLALAVVVVARGRLPARAQLRSARARACSRCAPRRLAVGGAGRDRLRALSRAAVTGAIVGVRNEREAAALAKGAEPRLTPDEIAAIAATT